MKTMQALIVALLALGFLAITGCKDSNSLVDPNGTATYDKLAAYTVFDNTNIEPADLSELVYSIDDSCGVYMLGEGRHGHHGNDGQGLDQHGLKGQMGINAHGQNGFDQHGLHGKDSADDDHGQMGPDGDRRRGPHGKGLRIRNLERIFKQLNLTPAQDSAVKICAGDFNACAKSAKATYDTARRTLYMALDTALKTLRQQVKDSLITKDSARAQARKLFSDYRAAVQPLEDAFKASLDSCWKAFMDCVKGNLTDDQWLKLQDLLKHK